jgi:hypothetical protein
MVIGARAFCRLTVMLTLSPNYIQVSGILNRNRALDGDLVAIELNDETEWNVLKDQIIEKVF